MLKLNSKESDIYMIIVDKSINKGTNKHTLLNIKEISIFYSDLIGVDYIDSGPIFNDFNILERETM